MDITGRKGTAMETAINPTVAGWASHADAIESYQWWSRYAPMLPLASEAAWIAYCYGIAARKERGK